MSKLAAILLIFVVFGASTQCLADCFSQKANVPPCHRHSPNKTPAPEHCGYAQLVAYASAALPPAIDTPILTTTAFELFVPPVETPENIASSFNVLRL